MCVSLVVCAVCSFQRGRGASSTLSSLGPTGHAAIVRLSGMSVVSPKIRAPICVHWAAHKHCWFCEHCDTGTVIYHQNRSRDAYHLRSPEALGDCGEGADHIDKLCATYHHTNDCQRLEQAHTRQCQWWRLRCSQKHGPPMMVRHASGARSRAFRARIHSVSLRSHQDDAMHNNTKQMSRAHFEQRESTQN